MLNVSAAFRLCERRDVGADFAWRVEEFRYCEQHVHRIVKHFDNILIAAMEPTEVGFLFLSVSRKSVERSKEKNCRNF